MSGFEQKLAVMAALLQQHELDALVLERTSSFAWATDGASSYINTASSYGEAALVITPDQRFLLTNRIEAPRLEKDEWLKDQGWEFRVGEWYQPNPAIHELLAGKRIAADHCVEGWLDLSAQMARLRANLTLAEAERFRQLANACAHAMKDTSEKIKPGMTEFEISALLGAETQRRGVQPVVILVAVDERIFNYRHPLPTDKRMESYAMLVLCGRWRGLVCSLTRLVHFGALPEEIRRKNEACAEVEACVLAATKPGATLGEIFSELQSAYARVGYADEWQLHHQGGAAGYEPREYLGLPGSTDIVTVGQVYAWNPSITGTKVEDSVLVGDDSLDILTEIPGWPVVQIKTPDGRVWHRPDILIR